MRTGSPRGLIRTDPPAAEGRPLAVLVYHRIAEVRSDRWGLAVSQCRFALHLRELAQHWPVQRLEDTEGRARGIAVTFDDGYEDNLTTAMPLLRKHGIPATFFLSGSAATSRGGFWWDHLDASLDAMTLDPGTSARLHRKLAAMSPEERSRCLDSLPSPLSSLPSRLRREQVVELAADPLADIGAHGWSHRAFPAMSKEDLKDDVEHNVVEVEAITGERPTALAYPFGLPPWGAGAVLRRAGIRTAYTLDAGSVTRPADPMALPRLQVGDWPVPCLHDRLERLLACSM